MRPARRNRRAQRARGCLGKISYPTEQAARRSATALGHKQGWPCHAYPHGRPCRTCGGYHIARSKSRSALERFFRSGSAGTATLAAWRIPPGK